MKRAVFLDRDGVLNAVGVRGTAASSPRTPDEFQLLPGVAAAVRSLRDVGMTVVVITNQPDLSRGKLRWEDLHEMHEQLLREVEVDRIEVCPHSGHEGCECRKPRPGMIIRAAHDLNIDLSASWTIGDRWVDIAAGAAAGTRTLLVEHEHSWSPTSSGSPDRDLIPERAVADLVEAAGVILADHFSASGPQE